MHCAALTADGRLFVGGGNASGQLGVQDVFERRAWEQAPVGAALTSVACGGHFTVAVGVDGALHVAGDKYATAISNPGTEPFSRQIVVSRVCIALAQLPRPARLRGRHRVAEQPLCVINS